MTTAPLAWRLLPLSLAEWRHQPGRHVAALLAIALGVAMAGAVHLINVSALAEFTQAVQSVEGRPDLSLRGPKEGFPDSLYEKVAAQVLVRQLTPLLELATQARASDGAIVSIRVIGVDALSVQALAPDLMPLPGGASDRLAVLRSDAAFLNAAARQALNLKPDQTIEMRGGDRWHGLRVAGHLAAIGPPLAVLDIAAAQSLFDLQGRLTRIDLRLRVGASPTDLADSLALPAGLKLLRPEDIENRIDGLSRAYRVNLTVLALVALFVGAFLVFTVQSLAVARRAPMLGLLGVLGMDAAQRRKMILLEAAGLGLLGSVLGLLAAVALARAALTLLAGDLGGGLFQGGAPALVEAPLAMLAFGLLGVAATLAGAWWPARQSAQESALQSLKGLTPVVAAAPANWPGALLMLSALLLALCPPIAGMPLAAYAAVAAWLLGGLWWVPALVNALLAPWRPPSNALAWLGLQRARQSRQAAMATVAGVVASVALSVSLVVMVSSFRDSMKRWLDAVLPAHLYARVAGGPAAGSQAWFDDTLVLDAAAIPGVTLAAGSRSRPLVLDAAMPAVVLVARPLNDPAAALPLVGPLQSAPPGTVPVYVSEAVRALHGAQAGGRLRLAVEGLTIDAFVAGVWRDYARPFGTVVMDLQTYQQITGDRRLNELALWLQPGQEASTVQNAVRHINGRGAQLEFADAAQLRALSLTIFDRSFAVTQVLQAVAVAIGLAGVAASLSAQALARRREFALLAHLGLTRWQIVAMVSGEAAAWLVAGVLAGLMLGLGVSVVLVHVVNPQSFHWSMDLSWPWLRMTALCGAVWLAGSLTATWGARSATAGPMARSVREDL